jgi:hypothetical protein
MTSQKSVGEPVESPDPKIACWDGQQVLDAGSHFLCRLVRERDGQNALRRNGLSLNEPRNSVDQNPGLAAARPG